MATKSTWTIDNVHSDITFKIKHMMISTVTGEFDDFTATIKTDDDTFANAEIDFSAKVASINTKNETRDNHLKSDDFFNAEKFPELTFKSKSFDGETLVGDLTIRDFTKEIELDVEFNGTAVDAYGQLKAGFELKGAINRKEFGLSWDAVTEMGNVVVSDKVRLVVDVQFVKQA